MSVIDEISALAESRELFDHNSEFGSRVAIKKISISVLTVNIFTRARSFAHRFKLPTLSVRKKGSELRHESSTLNINWPRQSG